MFDNRKRKKKTRHEAPDISPKLKGTIVGILVIFIVLGAWFAAHAIENKRIINAVQHTTDAGMSVDVYPAGKGVSAGEGQGAAEYPVNSADDSAAAAAQEPGASTMAEAPDAGTGGLSYYEYNDRIKKAEWQQQADGTVSYKGKSYRRIRYVKTILCLGIDRSDGLSAADNRDLEGSGRADAIFVIAHDTARDKCRILMIPRDTITEIEVYDGKGNYVRSQVDSLSVSYIGGGGGKKSCEITARAVSGVLCGTAIDHYMAIDMSVLPKLNDLAGGVTVTIPNTDLINADPTWEYGKTVTLKGSEAEKFLRYRDKERTGSPVMRMTQHRAYMLGFTDAVKRTSRTDSNIVNRLFDAVQSHMVTDMAKGEYMKLAMDQLAGGSLANEDIVSLPGYSELGADGYDIVSVNYEEAIPMILELFYREV